jgi:hypothetical protein
MTVKQTATVKFVVLATLLAAGFLSADEGYNINDFKRSYFKIITLNSGFYKVDAGFEKAKNEQPLLYGYIDKDMYTDVITISKDRRSTYFYFYNDAQGVFENSLNGPSFPNDEKIVSAKLIVAANKENYPDVLYITENTDDFSITMRVYSITYSPSSGLTLSEVPDYKFVAKTKGNKRQEPFNFQVFEDKNLIDYWLVNDGDDRKLVFFDRDSKTVKPKKFAELIDSNCEGCMSPDKVKDRSLNTIGTNAFVDLNRDCRADLVLESSDSSGNLSLEIYLFNDNSKFGLTKIIPLENGLTFGSFVDTNHDNAMDLVFYDKNKKKLAIYYSVLEGADKLSASSQCLSKGLPLSFPSLENKENTKYVAVQDLIANADIYEDRELRIYPLLRFVDIDLDGFLDIIAIFKVNDKSEVSIFKNNPCNLPQATGEVRAAGEPNVVPTCRVFNQEPQSDKIKALLGNNSIQSSAFDFGERG